MLARKIISVWILGILFAAASFAQVVPVGFHLRKKPTIRVGKSKGNHRGSKHKIKRRKR